MNPFWHLISGIRHLKKYYSEKEPQEINKEEIEAYLFHLVKARKIAPTTQNQIINAIKFYYEKVLHHPRQFYNLQRPKKNKQLPGVLSPAEVKRIIQATATERYLHVAQHTLENFRSPLDLWQKDGKFEPPT